MMFLIMQSSPTFCYFSILGPNILISVLFSNTLIPSSYLHVMHQVLHPHTAIGKIKVLHILLFTILDNKQQDKDSELNAGLNMLLPFQNI